MNHPIPVTNFHNELMVQKQIRDPGRALAPGLLFDELSTTTDADLRAAFVAYNIARKRVDVQPAAAAAPERGLLRWLRALLKAGN
jgi:hypothetical protein